MAPEPPNRRAGWQDIRGFVFGGVLCLGVAAICVCGASFGNIGAELLLGSACCCMMPVALLQLGVAGLAAAGVIRPYDRGDTN